MPKKSQLSGDPPPQRQARTRSSGSAQTLPDMTETKKRRPLEEPPFQRQVRPRSSAQIPSLPIPDDALSLVDSLSVGGPAAPSTSLPAEKKVPAGPANPGIVRKRQEGVLSKLPKDSVIVEVFSELRSDDNRSDAEALLKLITTYDVPLRMLHQISSNVYLILLHRWLYLRGFLMIYR